jgi:hypothetical protein
MNMIHNKADQISAYVVLPSWSWYDPAAQGIGDALPTGQYEPAGHNRFEF